MSHPFEKIFEKAITKSHGDQNVVLGEAERLMNEGYPVKEIYGVLVKLKKALIDPFEESVLAEAVEEFEQYVE